MADDTDQDDSEEIESEDNESTEINFDDFLAVWDVGNSDIHGKIVPRLPELYAVLDQVAAVDGSNFLPEEMSDRVGEHMMDGECVYQTAALCGCLANLPSVEETREDCDESSGTWSYRYYWSADADVSIQELLDVLQKAIVAGKAVYKEDESE